MFAEAAATRMPAFGWAPTFEITRREIRRVCGAADALDRLRVGAAGVGFQLVRGGGGAAF